MFRNLFKGAEVRRLKIDGTNWTMTAGTGDTLVSNVVDTDGYSGVAFIEAVGTLTTTATVSTSVLQSSDNNVADDYTAIAGSANVFVGADDNLVRITEIYRPLKRYMEFQSVRAGGANAVIDGLYVVLFHATNEPVTQGATGGGYVCLNSPAEGTP